MALSLPADDENQIKDKVFDQISQDELKSENGLNILLTFLYTCKHLGKDNLTDSVEKFGDFDNFQRIEGQTIQEYISMFDSKYRKIEKKDMPLPSEILAFKLLKKANITKEEKLLVLTGMNFDNKASLYEEAKASLKKFKGDDCRVNEKLSIKLEPAYLGETEDVLLAAGHVKNHEFNNHRRAREGRVTYEKSNTASQRKFNSQVSKRKMNPLGKDGRALTCKSCGSFQHMSPGCKVEWQIPPPGIFQWNLPEYSGLENMPKVANMANMENMILVL